MFESAVFGGWAQVAAGVAFSLLTIVQSFYWLVLASPSNTAIFIVSMEALAFASYVTIGNGFGVLKTEQIVETLPPDDC